MPWRFSKTTPTPAVSAGTGIVADLLQTAGDARRKAFLAEDDLGTRGALTEVLRTHAAVDVIGAASEATDASIWLAEHVDKWDLAIIDLFLEEGNGLTVLAGCRVRRPAQKVVVLSNHATRDMRRRCAVYGADAFFDKTTELDALVGYCRGLAEVEANALP